MALEGEHASEDILEAVLGQAFSPPPSRRQSVQVTSVQAGSPLHETTETPGEPLLESPTSSGSTEDSWKAQYESQVDTWRAQSSEAREKAEKERERWEAIRVSEREEAARRKAMGIPDEPATAPREQEHDAGWETVSHRKDQPTESTVASEELLPSADSRDLVAGEASRQSTAPRTTSTAIRPPAGIPETHSQTDNGDESQKWEDIQSSMTSSFPSMSYPERTETPSPSRLPALSTPVPLSATLAVFDSTLSTRTRVKALFSSLAVNLLLPFVNGVMLGFGEIFAKNVMMEWFGWKPVIPGHVAATAGMGAGANTKTPWGQRQKQKQP